MKRKTQAEVEVEIAKLKEMKPRVRRTTAFGDDNHAAIDAQIEALSGEVDEDDFEGRVESGEWSDNDRDSAQQAVDWEQGYTDEGSPSDNWSELVV